MDRESDGQGRRKKWNSKQSSGAIAGAFTDTAMFPDACRACQAGRRDAVKNVALRKNVERALARRTAFAIMVHLPKSE